MKYAGFLTLIFASAAVLFFVVGPRPAAAQGQRSSANTQVEDRRANMKQSVDNERLRKGQELDEKHQLEKEERTKRVNEAFRNIQIAHNDIIAFLRGPQATDQAMARTLAIKAREAATALRENLALPAAKESEKDSEGLSMPVNDQLLKICDLIKSFAANVNLSPTDKKAAVQARRDLDGIIARSLLIAPAAPPA